MYQKILAHIHHRTRIDAHYFLSGGFWSVTNNLIAILGGTITSILFAHNLTETDYGTYKYILGLATIVSVFSLSGLGQSILQASTKWLTYYRSVIRISFFYNIATFTLCLIGAIYYFVSQNTTLTIGFLLIGIFQPFINTFQFTPQFLYAQKKFKEATKVQIFKTILTSSANILCIIYTQNILILVAVYLLSLSLSHLITYYYFKSPDKNEIPYKEMVRFLSYAKHTSVRNIIVEIAFRIDTIIIFQQLGATQLAIFAIANIIPEQIKGGIKIIPTLLMPKYVQRLENLDLNKTIKSIPKRSVQLLLLFSCISIIYIIIAPHIYNIFFPKYTSSVIYTQLLALSFPAMVGVVPLSSINALKDNKALYKINIYTSLISILVTLVLISQYEIMGAVIAKIISRYINSLFIYAYVQNYFVAITHK